MSDLLPFLVVGTVTGCLYGLAATGLTLTYRTTGVFNLGHGAIAAGGAFAFYELRVHHGVPWPIALLLVVGVLGPLAGLAMEAAVRNLVGAAPALVIIGTVGVFLAVDGFLLVQSDSLTRSFPPFLPTSGFTVSGVLVSWGQLVTIGIAVAAVVGLYAYLRTARLGVAMRAVVDDPRLTRLVGESPERVRRTSWAIGCSFAVLSGVLLAPTLGLDANLLTLLVIQTFGACAIGRFASLPLTFAGGVAVGLLQSLSTKWFERPPLSGVPASVPFLVLVVVLLAVPGRLPAGAAARRFLSNRPRVAAGRARPLVVGAVVVGLVVVPEVVGTRLPLWTNGLVTAVLLGSLALLVYASGQISLCQAGLAAVGATSFSHLLDAGTPWLVALLGAGLLTVPVGAVVAVPAIRLSGLYLALATLGFGVLLQYMAFPTGLMFGKDLTVSAGRPDFIVDATGDTAFYYVVLAVAAAVGLLLVALDRSRLGRLLRAMSERPRMLATNGLEVSITRLLVICAASFLAGIAGALQVAHSSSVGASEFGPLTSLLLLVVLAVAGAGLVRAPLVGALLLAVLPGYVDAFGANEQMLLFGVAALVVANLRAARDRLDRWFGASTASDSRERSPVRVRLAEVAR